MDARFKKIELIVSDVDGVLTDGRIYFDAVGQESKVFNVRDAFPIDAWLRSGKKMTWFTGRKAVGTIARAKELGVNLILKAELKTDLLAFIKDKYQLQPEAVLYVGDDWNDLFYMRNVGIAVAPADASAENREIAALVTKAKGGDGVLAEVVERVMRAQGTWEGAVRPFREKFIL